MCAAEPRGDEMGGSICATTGAIVVAGLFGSVERECFSHFKLPCKLTLVHKWQTLKFHERPFFRPHVLEVIKRDLPTASFIKPLYTHWHRMRHRSARPLHIIDEAGRDGHEDPVVLFDVDDSNCESSTVAYPLYFVSHGFLGIRCEHEVSL